MWLCCFAHILGAVCIQLRGARVGKKGLSPKYWVHVLQLLIAASDNGSTDKEVGSHCCTTTPIVASPLLYSLSNFQEI